MARGRREEGRVEVRVMKKSLMLIWTLLGEACRHTVEHCIAPDVIQQYGYWLCVYTSKGSSRGR